MSRGHDALGCIRRAVVEAEQVLDLDHLRVGRGVMDVGEAHDQVIVEAPAPIAVVKELAPYLSMMVPPARAPGTR